MYQDRKGSEKKEILFSQLNEAEDVIFIGFGFDRDNLNQLGLPTDYNAWHMFCVSKEKGTIRCLNYKGSITGLSKDFEELITDPLNKYRFNRRKPSIIESTATTISDAYQNDFRKFLF